MNELAASPRGLVPGAAGPRGRPLVLAGFAAAIVLLVHGVAAAAGLGWLEAGGFRGPDDHTRMARVGALLEEGWYGPVVLERVGPEGLEHHWTRPMDALPAGLTVLLSLALPWPAAIELAGIAVSPLIHAVAAAGAVTILRRRLSEDALHVLLLALALTPAIFLQLAPGRPDHHGLEAALLTLLLATAVGPVLDGGRGGARGPAAFGVLAALLAWASPSGILPAVAGLGAWGLLWCVLRRRYAAAGALAAAVATLTAALVMPLERRPTADSLLALEPDRFSALHALLFAVLAAGLGGAALLDRFGGGRRPLRWAYALAGSGAAAALLLWLVPWVVRGGVTPVDPFYRATRGALIGESRPIFDGSLAELVPSAGMLGLGVAATLGCLAFAAGRRAWPLFALAVLAAYPAFHPESLGLKGKTVATVTVVPLIGYAGVVGDAAAGLRRRLGAARGALGAVGVKTAATAGVPVLALALGAGAGGSDGQSRGGIGPVRDALEALAERVGPNARVAAVPEVSAELLYRTDFRVLAIPNHRWQPGYRVMHRILSRRDPAAALALLRAREIAGVVAVAGYGRYFEAKGKAPSLHARLVSGERIPGLERLGLERGAAVYRVRPESSREKPGSEG